MKKLLLLLLLSLATNAEKCMESSFPWDHDEPNDGFGYAHKCNITFPSVRKDARERAFRNADNFRYWLEGLLSL